MGIKLNAARITLIMMLDVNIRLKGFKRAIPRLPESNEDNGMINAFRIIALRIARRMFVIGPAAAETAISLLGSLKFMGLIGTGFA